MSNLSQLIYEYQDLTSEIARLKDQIDTVYSAATNAKIKTITDMPLSPGFSNGGLADVLIQVEELEENIREIRRRRERVAEAIEGHLELIGLGGTERVVFWYRKIDRKRWHEISELTDKSVRQLHRIFKKAMYMSQLL